MYDIRVCTHAMQEIVLMDVGQQDMSVHLEQVDWRHCVLLTVPEHGAHAGDNGPLTVTLHPINDTHILIH